jgi:hypothetical protein
MKPVSRKRNQTASNDPRRGVAVVELAIVLPVILIMVLGTIEVCQRVFLRQTATIVAYEGARLASRRSTTRSDVLIRCDELLSERRCVGGTVTVTPENLIDVETGQIVTINVAIPWAGNAPTRFVLVDNAIVQVEAHMLRE